MLINHWGCTAILQIVMLVIGAVILVLAALTRNHDREWGKQLKKYGRLFTADEQNLLRRDDQYGFESMFTALIAFAELVGIVHLTLCFVIHKDNYITKYHNLVLHVSAVIFCISSILILISTVVYDKKYSEVEMSDTRKYHLRFQVNHTEWKQPSQSPFYYCHFGYGKPRKASELKGLRIPQSSSALCQLIGLKLVAAILCWYLILLCFLTKWQAASHERFLNSRAAKDLFELYGDLEEFEFEHTQFPSITEALVTGDDENEEILVPKTVKKDRRKAINVKDTVLYKDTGIENV